MNDEPQKQRLNELRAFLMRQPREVLAALLAVRAVGYEMSKHPGAPITLDAAFESAEETLRTEIGVWKLRHKARSVPARGRRYRSHGLDDGLT